MSVATAIPTAALRARVSLASSAIRARRPNIANSNCVTAWIRRSTITLDPSGLLDDGRPDSHDVLHAPCGRIPALSAGQTPVTEVAGYHGVLMSKERVTPNPIVTWSGEPFCVTSGESAGSPLSLSYSTNP